ncbi:hypothetical protein TELCIR_06235 [Teladorsagia circumcincta]|uniref:Uncharacterized protein n=1 Tax=Teladorsagia circumcincta TaxID=45464 RepID=A0A2G9UNL1_TELCI|nr:hypothetical protein TELCIR_06235 [Teladorsagia circumcincta]
MVDSGSLELAKKLPCLTTREASFPHSSYKRVYGGSIHRLEVEGPWMRSTLGTVEQLPVPGSITRCGFCGEDKFNTSPVEKTPCAVESSEDGSKKDLAEAS